MSPATRSPCPRYVHILPDHSNLREQARRARRSASAGGTPALLVMVARFSCRRRRRHLSLWRRRLHSSTVRMIAAAVLLRSRSMIVRHRVHLRRLLTSEVRRFAGVDEDWNLRLQLGAHLDRAFENFQVRASIAIDFHLVLRAAQDRK